MNWLRAFFEFDSILPYTFLALLTGDQLAHMLQSSNSIVLNELPLDGVLACARFHIKVASNRYQVRVIRSPVEIATASFFSIGRTE